MLQAPKGCDIEEVLETRCTWHNDCRGDRFCNTSGSCEGKHGCGGVETVADQPHTKELTEEFYKEKINEMM